MIDLEQLTIEEADQLSLQLGEKLRKIVDNSCNKANKLVNKYGMRTRMQFVLEKLEDSKTE